jgi:hypothetical protein
VVALQP